MTRFSGNHRNLKKAKFFLAMSLLLCHGNRKLEISTASTKWSRGNQLIYRRLSKTKSIGSGSDPESQAGRQTAMVDVIKKIIYCYHYARSQSILYL